MKNNFDALFPNQTTNVDAPAVEFEGSFLLKVPTPQPCMCCGNSTRWVDIYFEGHLCSGECFQSAWRDYQSALEMWRNE